MLWNRAVLEWYNNWILEYGISNIEYVVEFGDYGC